MLSSVFLSGHVFPRHGRRPKLLDQIRAVWRRRQYSLHTERAYARWVVRYVRFHDTTHLLRTDTNVRTIQKLLGHADLRTTMKCVHVLEQSGHAVDSPPDTLDQA